MTSYQETDAVPGSTEEVIKVRYTAKAHTLGDRRGGVSRSDDGRLDVKFPASRVPGTGTNPEQLFAAGWSACFISAMGVAANKMRVKLLADMAIDAEIDLCRSGDVYSFRPRLDVSLPGLKKPLLTPTQGPTAAVLEATITTVTWKTNPSWCVIAGNDRAVSRELEKAEAAGMKATSITAPSNHVPMLSHPKEVRDLIEQAAAKAGSR